MKTTKMNKAIGLLFVMVVLFFAGCANNQPTTTTTTPEATTTTMMQETLPETTTTQAVTTTMMATTMPVTTTTLSAPAGNTAYITIDAFDFDPRFQTVVKGDTVVWTNKQQSLMTVTSSDNTSELNSPTLNATDTYSHTFNKLGTYKYYSKIHTQALGTIYVVATRELANSTTGDINSAMGESSAGEPGITPGS